MKMVEYQHRCEFGGNTVRLDCGGGWEHGELVLVVSKLEFLKLIDEVARDAGLTGHTPNGAALNKRLMDLKVQIRKL